MVGPPRQPPRRSRLHLILLVAFAIPHVVPVLLHMSPKWMDLISRSCGQHPCNLVLTEVRETEIMLSLTIYRLRTYYFS